MQNYFIFLFFISTGDGDSNGLLRPVTDSITDVLKNNCRKIVGNCKTQPTEAQQKKQALKDFLIQQGRKAEDIERAFSKTLEAKVALLTLNGLNEVSPADDGTWGSDQLLSEQQAQSIIDLLASPTSFALQNIDRFISIPNRTRSTNLLPFIRIKRGPVLSFELYPTSKWTTTISYFVNQTGFTSNELFQITYALDTIRSKTCLKFIPLRTKPTTGYYISYAKFGGWGCGHSYIGRQNGGNPIALSTDGICKRLFNGIVIHETLHALGLLHEHVRYDREKFIRILWDNVDARYYDVFTVASPNSYTPYGVKYNLMSIMHYPAYLSGGAINVSKPVLATLEYPTYYASKIGYMDTFTDEDVDLIMRSYCKNPNCLDGNVGCGWHAANGLCATSRSMITACPRSCNTCSSIV